MDNEFTAIDWAILSIYMVVNFLVALYAAYRVRSLRDFSIASACMATPAIFATMAASFFGPGYSMGFAGKGYSVGLIFLPIFCAFGLKTVFEGLGLAPRLRRYQGAATLGDIIGFHHGKAARVLTGVLSVLFCAGIAGVVSRAAGVIINSFSGISVAVAAAMCAAIVVVYSALGGMWSSIRSDIFQFVVIAIIIPLVPIMLVFGIGLDETTTALVQDQMDGELWGSIPAMTFIGLFLSFLLGETLAPAYTQRIFVGRTTRGTQRAFLLAGVLFVPWAFLLLTSGILLRPVIGDVEPDSVLITGIIKIMPIGMKGLCCAALCSIIMSTMDSFLNSGATSFVYDIYLPLFGGNSKNREGLLAARVATVVIGASGFVFSVVFPSLIGALLNIYTLWAPTVVLPAVLAAFGIRTSVGSGLYAIIAGGLAAGLWAWWLAEPFGIPAVIPGLLANQFAYWGHHFASFRAAGATRENPVAADGSAIVLLTPQAAD